MADDLGPMAWSFLPENEQVQYLQKIAQMRIKSIRTQVFINADMPRFSARSAIFC